MEDWVVWRDGTGRDGGRLVDWMDFKSILVDDCGSDQPT